MDLRTIRSVHGDSRGLGKIIRDLCNAIESRDKKIAKYHFLLTQIVQLQKRESRKVKLRRVA